ncbi:MAG: hypothetical protein J0M16_06400 [Gammaproteobacteria bacterium]|jgi:hypothetical protein|nr:hypothetical protein [Gammaproteobacteria bacterium]
MSGSPLRALAWVLFLFAGGVRAETVLYLQGDREHVLWDVYAAGYGGARSSNTDDNGVFAYSLVNWSPLSDIRQTIEVTYARDDTRYSSHPDWELIFSPPRQAAFQPVLYESATRFPFHSGGEAGLAVASGTRGCNQSAGWFNVLDLDVSGSVVNRLAIDFMQVCEPGTNAVHETFEDPVTHKLIFTARDARLYGSLRINSDIAVVPAPPTAWLLVSAIAMLAGRWRAPGDR